MERFLKATTAQVILLLKRDDSQSKNANISTLPRLGSAELKKHVNNFSFSRQFFEFLRESAGILTRAQVREK